MHRALLWLTLISFLLYHAVILTQASFPSPSSYVAGLLASVGPFAALLLATAIGLPRWVTNALALMGGSVLVLVAGLITTGQAQFVVPAILVLFGIFSVGILVCALVARFLHWCWHRTQ